MPITLAARERLRDQQRREARQLDAVLAAQRRLDAQREKADRAIMKAEQGVAGKQADVDGAIAGLAMTSGVARAALLLGRTETVIARIARAARHRSTTGDADRASSTTVPA